MPILTVGGKQVEVGEGFRSLPPDEQQAMVAEIAKSIGAEAPSPVWSGNVLPVSKDASGNVSFDSNAGLLGALKSAATVVGDVGTGKIPTHLPNGEPNPELLRRAFDLASTVTPISPASRAGASWAGTMLPTRQRATVASPTAQMLKDVGGSQFDEAVAAGANGVPMGIYSDPVANLFRGLQTGLEERTIIAENTPETFAILKKAIADLTPDLGPGERAIATIGNLKTVREGFGDIAHGSAVPRERKASGEIVRAIDNFLENLDPAHVVAGTAPAEGVGSVSKTLADARGNWGAAQRSNDLTGTLDRAVTGITERAENRAQATNSGRNFDNALRQRVASMLERPKNVMGYSDAEIAALNEVLQGGFVRNRARDVGNVLGGGGGWGQAATAGMGAAMGAAAGGGTGAAIGAAAPASIGVAAKMLENALARRSMRNADAVTRQNSPIAREAQAAAPMLPSMNARDMAVLRAILPGLIAPQRPAPPAVAGFI